MFAFLGEKNAATKTISTAAPAERLPTASVHDVMCARRGGFLFIGVRRRGPGVGYKCTVQRLFNHSVCARLRRVSARSRYYYGRSNRISRAPGQSKPVGRVGPGSGVGSDGAGREEVCFFRAVEGREKR